MAILGGSNGDILTQDMMIVDFKVASVAIKPTDFEFQTALGKMCFSHSQNRLVHIGGLNSEGVDYSLDVGSTKWQQLDHDHSVLLNARGLELTYSSAVYFH